MALPDWLTQMDAQDTPAQPAAPAAVTPPPALPAANQSPAWLQQMDAQEPPQPVPVTPSPAPNTMQPSGNNYADAANFLRTALTHAAAGVVGIPKMFDQAGDFLAAKTGIGTPSTASPFAGAAPSADQADTSFFKNTAPAYDPQTTAGKYAMSAATMAAPALLGDPAAIIPNLIRGGAAGLAAKGAQDAGLPAWMGPAATFFTELAARHGLGAIAAPHTTSGAANIGRNIVNELPPVNAAAKPTLPGMQLTTGQLTGSPQWLALDNDMNDTAGSQNRTATSLAGNQAVIRDKLGQVAPGPAGADAAVAQTANVQAARQAATTTEDTAWKKIGTALFDTRPLKDQVSQFQADTAANLPASARKMPSADINDILNLPDTVPLRTLQDIRSSLGSTANQAYQAGDTQAAALAGTQRGVGGLLETHLNDPANLIVQTPDAMANYNAARAATKAKYDAFGDDNQAGAQISDLTSGKIAPESALSRMLPPGAEGTGTQSLSRLKLASGTGAGLDPARSYLIGKLSDAVNSGPNAFGKVMDDYGYAFKDKDMFTPAQQATLGDARDAVNQTYQTAPAGADVGAPTLSKLQGGSFARVLYGNVLGTVLPRIAKPAGSLAGGVIAAHTGLAPGATEITGNLMAGEAAGQAHVGAMAGARQTIMKLVDQARQDPALASQMQMKASQGNLALAPRLRNTLKMLGMDTALALPGATGGGVADQTSDQP